MGRVNAGESVGQINRQVLSCIGTVKLVAYALDNMIVEEREPDDMLDYIINFVENQLTTYVWVSVWHCSDYYNFLLKLDGLNPPTLFFSLKNSAIPLNLPPNKRKVQSLQKKNGVNIFPLTGILRE